MIRRNLRMIFYLAVEAAGLLTAIFGLDHHDAYLLGFGALCVVGGLMNQIILEVEPR